MACVNHHSYCHLLLSLNYCFMSFCVSTLNISNYIHDIIDKFPYLYYHNTLFMYSAIVLLIPLL